MPTLVSTVINNPLLPATYPESAKRDAGRFGASLTIASGQVLAKKTSDSKLYAYAGTNMVHTVAITGTLSAGGFRLRFVDKDGKLQTTALIAYNASTADIQTAIDAVIPQVSSASVVVAGGTAITASTLTFSGSGYAAKPWALVEVLPDGLTGFTGASVTDSTTYTGLETPVGLAEYSIKTDASGNCFFSDSTTVTDVNRSMTHVQYFISGIFKTADLTGWDATVAAAFKARTLASGNVYLP